MSPPDPSARHGRERIRSAISEVLASGPPRTAREIATTLRARNGFEDLQRHDINSILYTELRGLVECDGEFRWSLVPAGKRSDTRTSRGPDRPSVLRTIHRLRSGLPPSEHLDELTVTPDRTLRAIREFLSPARTRRWLIVSGDYGTGKTHSLSLVRDLALRSDLATCYLSTDGSGSALNHPPRFLHTLLSTLEMPGRDSRGYADLLHEMLTDTAGARQLTDIVSRHLRTGREINREVSLHVRRLAQPAGDDQADDDVLAWRRDRISYYLCGHSITHRAGPDARTMAYALLRVAMDVVRRMGARGLLVLIDEVESIYTKLSIQARTSAYRVLAALCESDLFGGCSLALAMTPDACRELARAVPEMLRDQGQGYPHESLTSLGRALAGGSVLTLECPALTLDVRHELLRRIRTLYQRAYPGTLDGDASEDAWRRYSTRLAAVDKPVRLLVRQAIDYLDCARYDGSSGSVSLARMVNRD